MPKENCKGYQKLMSDARVLQKETRDEKLRQKIEKDLKSNITIHMMNCVECKRP